MGKKYYLDEQGTIKLLQRLSKSINDKTSSKINISSVEDPITGEITEEVQNPGNFATNAAVADYVAKSRKKLTINQQSTVDDLDLGYDVVDNTIEYNGNETVQMNLSLVDATDIRKLFI